MSRGPTSPYRYDRAAIRLVLETQGLDEARKRWPRLVVDPIARVLGLTARYRGHDAWNPEWASLLGTAPDSIVAGRLGIPITTVRQKRVHLGIPTANRKAFRAAKRAVLVGITDEELISGRVDVLAAKYAISVNEISIERKRRALRPITKTGKLRKPSVTSDLRRIAVWAIRDAHPDATLEAIGNAVGCTREYVRQLLYERNELASRSELAS